MGIQTAGVTTMIAVLTAGVTAQEPAAAGSGPTVVLHVTDYAPVSRSDLAEAEELATGIYRAAGVRTIWIEGAAATVLADDAFHVDVILLSKEMVAQKCRLDAMSDAAFGAATRSTRRAYIFYSPSPDIPPARRARSAVYSAECWRTRSRHVLLPANGHSTSGVMQGNWDGRIARVPGFTKVQAATIRSLLTVANAN
jgi:hypothetical protein